MSDGIERVKPPVISIDLAVNVMSWLRKVSSSSKTGADSSRKMPGWFPVTYGGSVAATEVAQLRTNAGLIKVAPPNHPVPQAVTEVADEHSAEEPVSLSALKRCHGSP